MTKKNNLNHDLINYIIHQWHVVDPKLDTQGTAIIGRIVRLNSFISRNVDANLAQYKLTVGEFDVLAALVREDKHQLTPGKLQELIMISSGGLTNRINRLEKRALIVRLPDPNDRRGVIVELTDKGKALILKVAPTHLAVEKEIASPLSSSEQETLIKLIKKMLSSVDPYKEP